MTRTLAALLLAAGLLLTGCSDNLSGDSNPGSQTDTTTPQPAPS